MIDGWMDGCKILKVRDVVFITRYYENIHTLSLSISVSTYICRDRDICAGKVTRYTIISRPLPAHSLQVRCVWLNNVMHAMLCMYIYVQIKP